MLTWIHYRGLLIGALLAAGNLFCGACPMILVARPRPAAAPADAALAAWLRRKWVALALFVAVLFAYELFDLWACRPPPRGWSSAISRAALLVDLTFTGATFCKYVCPVGQFNFVASTLSPLEIGVARAVDLPGLHDRGLHQGAARRPSVAAAVDRRSADASSALFLPLKVGNLDCTFCLDCVQACPHDNIAIRVRVPGEELADDAADRPSAACRGAPISPRWRCCSRSAALLNAFAMTGPVYARRSVAGAMRSARRIEAPVLGLLFVAALGVAAARACRGRRGWLTRRLAGSAPEHPGHRRPLRLRARAVRRRRLARALRLPLPHRCRHRRAGDAERGDRRGGPRAAGEPDWRWLGMRPGAVFPLQLGAVLLGALGSLVLVHRISERDHPAARDAGVGAVGARDRRAGAAGAVDPRAADGDERHGTRRMSRLPRSRRWSHPPSCSSAPARARRAQRPAVSDRLGPDCWPLPISIWTDPDTTDDGKAAGQFWVMIEAGRAERRLPSERRRAWRSVRPIARDRRAKAAPSRSTGSVARQFVALLMDHEGPFGVRVAIDGPLGRAAVEGQVDATYDLRPAPGLIALYLVPFALVGALWAKVLLRRRQRRDDSDRSVG